MILSQPDLRRAVKRGRVVFAPPLEDKQWGPVSVDLRLGYSFTKLRDVANITVSVAQGLPDIGPGGFWQTAELAEKNAFGKPEFYDLEPGGFVLAMTHESVTVPPDMVALVEGRSTYARMGLSMHQTAPWIQPGWTGRIVLEIRNGGPLTIRLTPLIDRPCQLSFFRLTSPVPREQLYGTRGSEFYANQKHPLEHDRTAARKPKPASQRKRSSKTPSAKAKGKRARRSR
ncbi:MAG: dCTP deaminase [Candidatus Binatia bacterium]